MREPGDPRRGDRLIPARPAAAPPPPGPAPSERRVLGVAYGAHVLHDGYADAVYYLLLPAWRAEFGFGYAVVGILRGVASGMMAVLQRPSALAAERLSRRAMLAAGTALVGAAWLLAGASGTLAVAVASLVLGGLGGSTQHPLASAAVASVSEGRRSRDRLATYNFSGDVGKMLVPAAVAALLTRWTWRPTMLLLGAIAVVASAGVLLLPRERGPAAPAPAGEGPPGPAEAAGAAERRGLSPDFHRPAERGWGGGFPLLLAIGVLDSATRMGFLTFLPYLLAAKGAPVGTLGLALTLVFAGGAAGKLACGLLGARLGVVGTVIATEALTAAGILALLPAPLPVALALLPAIGVCLNGTSSVLYGSVPELVPPAQRQRAFGLFYTGTIGAGALSPALYGWVGDVASVPALLVAVALMVLVTLPLAARLRGPLAAAAP
jgi:MFS family permease